jgi:hypothetical protein
MANRGDTVVIIVCGLALAAAVTVARAQGLPDPTRPPATLESPAATAGAGAEKGAATGVQSIIRSNCGKPAAIVKGEYAMLGGRVGDAVVVEIGEDFVTLKGPEGEETLKLIPGVEKTPVANGAAPAEKKGACARAPGDEEKR